MTTLQVEARSVYGQTKYYPMNEAADILCRLTNTKTLTKAHFDAARSLGWDLQVVMGAELDSWLTKLIGEAA